MTHDSPRVKKANSVRGPARVRMFADLKEACKLSRELQRASNDLPGERPPREVYLELEAALNKINDSLPG